ncbi:MAG: NYN domain-containing protein [Actinomycetes bacterium]
MRDDVAPFTRMAEIQPPQGRYAVLVDAGYLISSAGDLVVGTARRRDLTVDATGLIASVMPRVTERFGTDLLRVYWYDAARDRVPTVQQRQVAGLPHLKLRLGNVNRAGVQKGVDALLRIDLVGLAAARAVRDVVLVAGDEDMLEAVESAQAYGIRVHLWGVEPPFGVNQSERLVWESDTVHVLGREAVADYVRVRVPPGDRATRDAMAAIAATAATPATPAAPAADVTAAVAADDDEAGAASPQGVPVPPQRPTPAQVAASLGVPGRAAAPQAPRTPPPVQVGLPEPVDLTGSVALPAEELVSLGRDIAGRWLVERGRENLADLLPGPELPSVIDQELLVAAEGQVGFSLRAFADARASLRAGFWERLYKEFDLHIGVSDH